MVSGVISPIIVATILGDDETNEKVLSLLKIVDDYFLLSLCSTRSCNDIFLYLCLWSSTKRLELDKKNYSYLIYTKNYNLVLSFVLQF